MVVLISMKKFVEELNEVGLGAHYRIRNAINQVIHSQDSQRADDGNLQIEQHILPVTCEVMQYLRIRGKLDPEIVATALLHDVLEDDRSIDEEDFRERFGLRIYNNVKMLTKLDWRNLPGETDVKKKAHRDEIYFMELEKAPREVLIVKLADRLNNVSRLGSSPEKGKKDRYVRETIEHYLPLAEKHSQYFCKKIRYELDKIID